METIEKQTEISLEDMREILEQLKISMEEDKNKIVREIEEEEQEKIKLQVETALEQAKNEAMFEIKSLKPILLNIEDKKDYLCGELRKYCDFKDTTIGYAYINSGCPEMSDDEWIKTITDFYNKGNGEGLLWEKPFEDAKNFLYKIFMIRFLKIGIDKCSKGNSEKIGQSNKTTINNESLQKDISLDERLPAELNIDKAQKILQKAIQANLCDENYTWKETQQLLAYFADKMSHYLELTKKMGHDGEIQTSWKPFETLFEYEGKVQGKNKLKGAKQNWMRLNTKFEPTGYERIDALFD